MNPVWIIGTGINNPPSLPPMAQEAIHRAQVLIGGERLLKEYEDYPAEKIVIRRNIAEIIARIEQRGAKKIVILASGDPGFHSIAGTVLNRLPEEDIRVIPNVNALQTAFARIGVTWDDAIFVSAHAHPLSQVVGWAKHSQKLGVLTDSQQTPAVIAETLLQAGVPDCRVVVAENLGESEEHIVDTYLSELVGCTFAPLNVLLVLQGEAWRPEPVFANRDETAYQHRRGLITKSDLRALSIARMRIRPTDVVWDIGAGSGAVSIEMAELAWQGKVFAIEKDTQNLSFIKANRKEFGSLNLEIISGEAPDALMGLPAPQSVFIGGSGGNLTQILQQIDLAAPEGCCVVCNFATFESLNTGLAAMKDLRWEPTFSQINIAHSKQIAALTRLEPLNPVFILEGTHP